MGLYLLIHHWFLRVKASQAAMTAMLINRVRDIGLVLAMIRIIEDVGGLEYSTVESVFEFWGQFCYSWFIFIYFYLFIQQQSPMFRIS